MTDTPPSPIRPALTVKDLTIVLGVGATQVRRMIRNGELPTVSSSRGPGSIYSVPAAAFDAWIQARAEQAAAQSIRAQRATAVTTDAPILIHSTRKTA